jgi:hypothetical protein
MAAVRELSEAGFEWIEKIKRILLQIELMQTIHQLIVPIICATVKAEQGVCGTRE